MPRRKGMIGPGAGAMGGIGRAPMRPPTPMGGRPPMGAPGGLPGGGAGGGAPGMGGLGAGPIPGGAPVARSPASGMGGTAGFKHGGEAEKKRDRHEKLARGGSVGIKNEGKKEEEREEKDEAKGMKFRKGGMVGDAKSRTGRDTAKGGKAC